MSDNKPKPQASGGTEGADPKGPKPVDTSGDNAQLKARLEQFHAALGEKDELIAAQQQRIAALQAELAETRKGAAAPNTLVPLEGLPKGALRLLASTVLMDDTGGTMRRIYAKRGDVAIPGGSEKVVRAAQKAVGSRARVYPCSEQTGEQLLEGVLAEQA